MTLHVAGGNLHHCPKFPCSVHKPVLSREAADAAGACVSALVCPAGLKGAPCLELHLSAGLPLLACRVVSYLTPVVSVEPACRPATAPDACCLCLSDRLLCLPAVVPHGHLWLHWLGAKCSGGVLGRVSCLVLHKLLLPFVAHPPFPCRGTVLPRVPASTCSTCAAGRSVLGAA